MEFRKLGRTDLDVSLICLGTMTWGSQNTEAEAHEQIAYALDQGINFMDTAEMYPVTPSDPATRGRTESYIGSWFARNGRRDDVILATKVCGPHFIEPLRGAEDNRLNRKHITEALDASLKRLNTDRIDLYQLHWPERAIPRFGRRGLSALSDAPDTVPIEETLEVLGDLVRAGKIRHIGVSNETAWGVSEFLRIAREHDQPRVVSVQNPYNLLNREFEGALSEFALREHVGLLAYSPLGAGCLTGKYLGGVAPEGSRLTVAPQFTRYATSGQPIATARYVGIAHAFGLDPAQMALAYVNSRAFTTATIIGATSMDQLRADIGSIDIRLPDECVAAIENVHRDLPNPCP